MHKIVNIYVGALHIDTVYSIIEINSEETCVTLPSQFKPGSTLTHIGYEQDSYVDTRSEYERWKDEYEHSYYPTRSAVATEVSVSPNVKKIVIPHTIEHISRLAFKNLRDVEFEIDENNPYYQVIDGKIVKKSSGEVIWPYSE